jgi:hypothetical protein
MGKVPGHKIKKVGAGFSGPQKWAKAPVQNENGERKCSSGSRGEAPDCPKGDFKKGGFSEPQKWAKALGMA